MKLPQLVLIDILYLVNITKFTLSDLVLILKIPPSEFECLELEEDKFLLWKCTTFILLCFWMTGSDITMYRSPQIMIKSFWALSFGSKMCSHFVWICCSVLICEFGYLHYPSFFPNFQSNNTFVYAFQISNFENPMTCLISNNVNLALQIHLKLIYHPIVPAPLITTSSYALSAIFWYVKWMFLCSLTIKFKWHETSLEKRA